jgi:hypothetical protein
MKMFRFPPPKHSVGFFFVNTPTPAIFIPPLHRFFPFQSAPLHLFFIQSALLSIPYAPDWDPAGFSSRSYATAYTTRASARVAAGS